MPKISFKSKKMIGMFILSAFGACHDQPMRSSAEEFTEDILEDPWDGDVSAADSLTDVPTEPDALDDEGSWVDTSQDSEGDVPPMCSPELLPGFGETTRTWNWYPPPFPSQRANIILDIQDRTVVLQNQVVDAYKAIILSGENGDLTEILIRQGLNLDNAGVIQPTVGQEVVVTGVSCDEGGYTVIENLGGEIIWEGGDDSCQCQGDITGFEMVCQPSRRFALDRRTRLDTVPLCRSSSDAPNPKCDIVHAPLSAMLRTDDGMIELPRKTPIDVMINRQRYKAVYAFGGFYNCPCDSCGGFRSSFLMLPTAP